MKKFKRLTAGLLGAVMALSVCSFTALAADGDVAKIGETGYETLQQAVDAAGKDDRIVLLKNVKEDIVVKEDDDIILDLNGKDITNLNNHTITNKGKLKIKGEGTVDNVTHAKAAIFNEGTVVLNGGNYTRSLEAGSSAEDSGENSYYTLLNHGNMTINDGVRVSQGPGGKGQFSSLVENGWYDGTENGSRKNSVMIIYGGVFNGGLNTIKNDDWGELIINDGTFKNTAQASFLNWNIAEVNGGTFQSEKYAVILGSANETMDRGELTINGGTFESESHTIAKMDGITPTSSTKIEINGGTFESNNGEVFDSELKAQQKAGKLDIAITSGSFTSDVSDYMDDESKLVKDEDGNFVIMTEKEYEDYLDSKKPSHSYELEEGRVEKDDEEDEKNEPVVTPEEEAGPFSDVGKDNPNYDAIIKVYENGWMAGIGEGVFAPNGTLTRAMGATVLWNKAGKPEPQNVAPFLDVTGDAWYAKAVAWAYEQGIIAGYGDVFGPDDALTTEQFERMSAIANGKTPEIYVGGAPNATRGWVASLLAM